MDATNPVLTAAKARRWNPYAVGVGIGLLSCATVVFSGKFIGTSTSFVHMAGFFEGLAAPQHVLGAGATPYFAKEISAKNPMFDWQMMLVLGVFLGSFVSSRLSGASSAECVPGLWAWRFGPSKAVRYASSFFAGVLMLFGARLAGGCTSGHAISGGLQLAVSSWVFFVAMFGTGIATAFALFGTGGRGHVRD